MTTAAPTGRARLEAEVLRLLREGYTVGQVVDRIPELDHDAVRAIGRGSGVGVRPGGAAANRELPVALLDPHPDNIRDNDGDLTELAESIRSLGVLQPLLVTPNGAARYTVIAGHRRLQASKLAGLSSVPVMVRAGVTGAQALEAMLVENLHRKRINPIEEAQGYQALVGMGRGQAEIAKAIGKPQSHVSRMIDLLLLDPEEQRLVASGQITVARAHRIATSRRDKRADHGGSHRMGFRVPHFTNEHPLAEDARIVCRAAQHAGELRIGPACGPCWEQVIREDEELRGPPDFDDRRRLLVCARCGLDGRAAEKRCVVVDDDGTHRWPEHSYVNEEV